MTQREDHEIGRIPDDAQCLGCRYSLRGLTGDVCPECGRAFDPANASTYWRPVGSKGWRRWARPPRAWHVIGVPLATFSILVGRSGPYCMSLWGGVRLFCLVEALLIVLGIAAIIDYAVAAVACVMDRDRRRFDRDSSDTVRSKSWHVLPICLAVLLSAWMTEWPMSARFSASRQAMERAAIRYLDGTLTARNPGWIGLYRFDALYTDDPGVGFMKSGGYWEFAGFYFSPDDVPPKGFDILRSRRIAPKWFIFEWDF